MRVFVYFNLHKHCFSIRAMEGPMKGRVIGHRDNVILYKPTFKVSEAGRQRVIREQRKNVHAGVVGEWFDGYHDSRLVETIAFSTGSAVTYNPYKYDSFVYRSSERRVNDDKIRVAALQSINGKAAMYVERSLS